MPVYVTLLHRYLRVLKASGESGVQVCAGLFCWTGVLGLAGSCRALISECLVRHRADTVAAAHALGLKAGVPPHRMQITGNDNADQDLQQPEQACCGIIRSLSHKPDETIEEGQLVHM
jgi:hypothetical protein